MDINTQQSFEALSERAVAVVVDPIQSVKGKVLTFKHLLLKNQDTQLNLQSQVYNRYSVIVYFRSICLWYVWMKFCFILQVVIDAFRLINPNMMVLGQEPRQTTSNLGHLNKPSIQVKNYFFGVIFKGNWWMFFFMLWKDLAWEPCRNSFRCRLLFMDWIDTIILLPSTTERMNWSRR